MGDFDVIVIGGGPAGEHCADRLTEGGKRVASSSVSCSAGSAITGPASPRKPCCARARRSKPPGARRAPAQAATGTLDAQAAFGWRDYMTSRVDGRYNDTGSEAWAEGAGIEVLRGQGRVSGPGRVAVDGVEHAAEHVVLATGSYALIPPVDGLRELDGIWTNRGVTASTRFRARSWC